MKRLYWVSGNICSKNITSAMVLRMLPNPEVLHKSISLIVQAFSDVVQMEASRVRWEEIKRLQTPAPKLSHATE